MSTAQSALADEEVDDNNNNVDNSDDSDCGEDEYAVERILGRRRTGDGKKYEVGESGKRLRRKGKGKGFLLLSAVQD